MNEEKQICISRIVSFYPSGGRLVTVRGMFFKSTQMITVQFSYRKWNARLKVGND